MKCFSLVVFFVCSVTQAFAASMETWLCAMEGKGSTIILSKDAIISETETEKNAFFNKGLKLQLVIESEKSIYFSTKYGQQRLDIISFYQGNRFTEFIAETRTALTTDGKSVPALYNYGFVGDEDDSEGIFRQTFLNDVRRVSTTVYFCDKI